MLSEKTIKIIKSTVPVLEKHGIDITKRFYQLLFTKHPELLNIFNHANQKQGRQQTALANAVYAAAQYIDKLETIIPVVKQIGHKHRSLGIKAEHYPIVGENLLAAIKDVLGDLATDEILQAWAEAYGVIADAFIGVEAEFYKQAEQQQGGWEGFRAFKVDRKVKESDVITSFYLVPQDGEAIALFEPGQYVSVKVDIPGEENTHIRQYSLSDAPGKPYYRISVKREDGKQDQPAGKVSVYLHEQVEQGDVLLLSAPAGDFVLDQKDDRPVVLISGGVGLTPLVSMLNTLVETNPNRQVTFIHAAQNGQVHAMREHVEELARQHSQLSVHWCYDNPTDLDRATKAFHKEGYVDLSTLEQMVPSKDASFYFCGPTPFMKALNQTLKEYQIAEEDIHFEFFGPADSL
ncbi:NO-inducible flavohemoprotein [Brevibacillus laterosporus]|uniref:NO-inducible flavohemoprotein n=1 Tax=Brevibacillus laterosporus TaxID=1465 RepID=UPI000371390D|nr:NO-inducible flavohemoprotein [Brevibacillus laterosporus]ATO49341.1 nitric oxide dioxygenase [Brevibacillus laterosporus DSM 25]MBG9800779.1 dihydropteridine reductase [Brevibacillus laterosporus]MED2004582.1 NO-inducible flavohemoprotein [Brevibacillus laterosporus]MED4762235.1 NO-inducible flavohemoprotein [Brevibacillus laterosporus]NKQ21350.1 NO-inducible flavohemoprotein [Brevibacillus laterosporus]